MKITQDKAKALGLLKQPEPAPLPPAPATPADVQAVAAAVQFEGLATRAMLDKVQKSLEKKTEYEFVVTRGWDGLIKSITAKPL